jgi:predicted DNA-binding transcriptional regulator YafY
MPANKFALLRYRVIDRCLTNKSKPYPSREELREACEEALFGSGGDAISLSTIDKDIWAMKNESELGYYAPITYSRLHKGYFYEEEGYSIATLTLGQEDLEAIRFAAATLEQFKHVPIFKQYESAIEKIFNRVNIAPQPDDEQLEHFIQFEKSTVSKGKDYLWPLLEAIRAHKTVRIQYLKFSDDQLKEYELHPYLLKEYQNRWYLIAFEKNSGQVRTYGLERIEALETAEQVFLPHPNFKPETFFEHSIGITEKADEPQDVLLSLNPIAGKFMKTQPLHPSQRVVMENDREIRISLHVLLTEELYSFILSQSNQVQVIAPEQLRKEIKTRLSSALKSY